MAASIQCPVCDRSFRADEPSVALPFCSPRCKKIDAVRWLGESYGLPYEADEETVAKRERDGDTDSLNE